MNIIFNSTRGVKLGGLSRNVLQGTGRENDTLKHLHLQALDLIGINMLLKKCLCSCTQIHMLGGGRHSVFDKNEYLDQIHIYHCQISLCSDQSPYVKAGLNQRVGKL